MESFHNPNDRQPKPSLYPQVILSHPDSSTSTTASSSKLYPEIDMQDLVENLFPHQDDYYSPSAPPAATEEVLIRVPGAILHLIDKSYSVELACGDLTILRLIQGQNIVAILVRVADDIQWPLTKDAAAVKLDGSHYFFSLPPPKESDLDSSDDEDKGKYGKSKSNIEVNMLNYGLTILSKGQEPLLKELDRILGSYCSFSEQKVSEKAKQKGEKVLDISVVKETSPAELKEKKELVEERCAAYWTTLAPNVEDYSGKSAKLIAAGSGKLIKGILWCGDVTVDRLNWGNDVLKRRMTPAEKQKEISPETLARIQRVKRMTKMTEKVAQGVLCGVVKVSGFFTSSVANSKVGKKFFGLLPGEIVLASLDGFNKICDAVEVAGKNVMSTSSTVTTELVDHRYGEKAAEATNEGLGAAGHAIGTAWTAFKIRKALNPKSVLKPSSLAKSAAKAAGAEMKAKKGSK